VIVDDFHEFSLQRFLGTFSHLARAPCAAPCAGGTLGNEKNGVFFGPWSSLYKWLSLSLMMSPTVGRRPVAAVVNLPGGDGEMDGEKGHLYIQYSFTDI